MSGRCKACDVELTDQEMCTKNPENNQYLELCYNCLEETKLAEEGYYDGNFTDSFIVSHTGNKTTYME